MEKKIWFPTLPILVSSLVEPFSSRQLSTKNGPPQQQLQLGSRGMAASNNNKVQDITVDGHYRLVR
jgi:hypothetical protein